MLSLQESITRLADFKANFSSKYGIKKLGIFGSTARKENHEGSDLDIIVEVEKPSLSLMYDLRETLKAFLGLDIDLVRYRETLSPMFKHNIDNEAIYVCKDDLPKLEEVVRDILAHNC